ncbi:hypothetical protein [Plantactinospora sp. GCM10030261]|uniref:hypothetical protein n=1 Tax=Plantactinospora sp. GCM10030261 TaxID=3273420 RepID=UPI00361E3875
MLASRAAGAPRRSTVRARSSIVGAALLAGGTLLVGCGAPPELAATPSPTPSRVAPTATGTPTSQPRPTLPVRTPTAGATTGVVARPCGGRPAGSAVIALLRRERGLLPDRLKVTVTTGPLCAGEWQYTVVEAAGHEPLQAVSRGRPSALTLVTAGTDVCSIPVRTAAPPGIQTLACDGPAVGPPPA